MEVSFEQLATAVAALLLAMSTAVGVMFKWILNRFSEVEGKLSNCHKEREETSTQLARLTGQVEEMQRHNPVDILTKLEVISNAVLNKPQP